MPENRPARREHENVGMTEQRRIGSEHSRTRQLLLDVTERLMLEEGYAAVGVRRVAREAGVTPALVLYYFRTLDDLFLAVLRRRADEEMQRQQRIAESGHPLRTMWELSSQPHTALIMEFMALANHRKAIRAQIAEHAERYRQAQLDALTRRAAEGGLGDLGMPPLALLVLNSALSRTLMVEKAMGLTTGHAETLALVEDFLRRFEKDAPASPDGRAADPQAADPRSSVSSA